MGKFEQAIRAKVRFALPTGGIVSSEDLYDLPLSSKRGASLDNLAKSLNRVIKEISEESFVGGQSKDNALLNLKFDIVKHVIKVKMEESKAKLSASRIKEKQQQLLSLIADKENSALAAKSIEELTKMYNEADKQLP